MRFFAHTARLTRAGVLALTAALALLLSGSSGQDSELMFTITGEQLQALKLAYYSDYFSFIGGDEQGMVAFALDNNRGRDGDSWQAEHFVVLHDEKAGWQNVSGDGPYYNVTRQLESIPDSPDFSFIGKPETGLTIRSMDLVRCPPRRSSCAVRNVSSAASAPWRRFC